MNPQLGHKVSEENFPFYSWSEGSFYYKVERNHFNGDRELVCRIWKRRKEAQEIAKTIAQALSNNKSSTNSK